MTQEILGQNDQLPLRSLFEKFWAIYVPDRLTPALSAQFPATLSRTELIAMGKDLLVQIPKERAQSMLEWAENTTVFAQAYAPEPACIMRQVFSATFNHVLDAQGRVVGTLSVSGVNGMPVDHLQTTIFTPEETMDAVFRGLTHLYNLGKLGDARAFEALQAQINSQVQNRRLTCPQINRLLAQTTGVNLNFCRRRTVKPELPKDRCPSILCGEGNGLANTLGIGKIAFQLIYEPGYENIMVAPIAHFNPSQKDQSGYLWPAFYEVHYQAQGSKGTVTGVITIDQDSVHGLSGNGYSPYKENSDSLHNVDLMRVRKMLTPSPQQTNVIVKRIPSGERGYFEYQITFVNPNNPNDQTTTLTLDPYGIPWFCPSEVVEVGTHKLLFKKLAITTSDPPCPRCTHTIIDQGIPYVVVSGGKMRQAADYYEVATLYYLWQKGVIVVNSDLMALQYH